MFLEPDHTAAWTMDRTRRLIEDYVPRCAQEEGDRLAILRALRDFPDALERTNRIAHLTASSWIVNRDRTKVLMVYHNLYDSWSWTGGHADGDPDLMAVAIREAIEETGASGVRPVAEAIFALDVLPVWSHFKKGLFVPSHLHLNAAWLLEADEDGPLTVREEENSGVRWIPVDEIRLHVSEPDMLPVYDKLAARVRELG